MTGYFSLKEIKFWLKVKWINFTEILARTANRTWQNAFPVLVSLSFSSVQIRRDSMSRVVCTECVSFSAGFHGIFICTSTQWETPHLICFGSVWISAQRSQPCCSVLYNTVYSHTTNELHMNNTATGGPWWALLSLHTLSLITWMWLNSQHS